MQLLRMEVQNDFIWSKVLPRIHEKEKYITLLNWYLKISVECEIITCPTIHGHLD